MIVQKDRNQLYFLFIFCLSTIYFFRPVIVPFFFLQTIFRLLLLVILYYSFSRIFNRRSERFEIALKILIVSVVISILTATFFWKQNITLSFLAALPMFSYCLFFYLVRKKIKIVIIEKLIVLMGLSYIMIFLISFFSYPTPLFGDIYHWENEYRGFQRILTNGAGFLFLILFMSLNKFVVTKKNHWLSIYIVAFACTIMTLTRVYIVAATIISIFYFLIKTKLYVKIILTILFLFVAFKITETNFFRVLEFKTSNDLRYAQDYIRIASAYFYLSEFSPNLTTEIFGNGMPHSDSMYGKYVLNMEEKYHFYTSDLGFIGLFIRYGSLALLSYIFIYYFIFVQRLPKELKYIKMFMIFVLLNGLTNEGTFHPDFIIPIVLSLYLFHLDYINNNQKERQVFN